MTNKIYLIKIQTLNNFSIEWTFILSLNEKQTYFRRKSMQRKRILIFR